MIEDAECRSLRNERLRTEAIASFGDALNTVRLDELDPTEFCPLPFLSISPSLTHTHTHTHTYTLRRIRTTSQMSPLAGMTGSSRLLPFWS